MLTNTKRTIILGIGAAVILAVTLSVTGALRGADAKLKAAEKARDAAITQVQQAASFAELQTQRASLAEARADSLDHRKIETRIRFVEAAAKAPQECQPVVIAANAAIATADSAANAHQEAAKDLRAAVDTLLPPISRLTVAQAAVEASKPGLRLRIAHLLPRPQITVAAGIDVLSRKPAAVVGLGYGWSF